MRVQINDILIFDEDTMSFSPINSFLPTVKLGSIHARCFSYLCQKKIKDESVVSKKELFYEGWEKHGLVSSDNSLAQTIFQIRKALRPFNLSDAIGTIPRVGFALRQVTLKPIQTSKAWELHNISDRQARWPFYFLGARNSEIEQNFKLDERENNELTSAYVSKSTLLMVCVVLTCQYWLHRHA